MSTAILQVRDVVKDYRALRPLRVQSLDLREGEHLALLGFDQAGAEVLVNLLTGALLPDAGTVSVFGEPTSAITNAEGWVRFLDQFGLISERAVMLDQLSAGQNLAMPRLLATRAKSPANVRVSGPDSGALACSASSTRGESANARPRRTRWR